MPVKNNGLQEPSMYLQRPSTGKSQDVRHILTKTFRELYTRDAIRTETVKNLQVSKDCDDPYHERYVDSLQKIYSEWQRRMDEAAMLERHIMQAQARAMSADERELNRIAQSWDAYQHLGLPPSRSHFSSCIDTELLRKHHLITPDDYAQDMQASSSPPPAPKIPNYARDTLSSQRSRHELSHPETPLLTSLAPELTSLAPVTSQDFSCVSSVEMKTGEIETCADITKHENWKKHMSEEQREIERRDLANLQAKVHYLRNPRCVPSTASTTTKSLIKHQKKTPKLIGIEDKTPDIKSKEPTTIFQPSPPVITFTNYSVGEVYEIILELKNVSTVLRQCRTLPLSTPYFTVGLGQFPGEHGLVAPGMSCKYPVRFIPDALCDFEDQIVIQTQSSKPLIVPVRAHREPPSLACEFHVQGLKWILNVGGLSDSVSSQKKANKMPSKLRIGYCLVGGCHVTQFVVHNDGGPGRFCILPKSSWPATNFRSAVTNGGVTVLPFEVQPSTFELVTGQSGVIEIIFTPNMAKEYYQDLVLLCDNCQLKQFTLRGEGQIAKVELGNVEQGLSERQLGERCDKTAKQLIRFEELNPFTYTDRNIVVKNCNNVELPFQWMVYKPQMQPPDIGPDEQFGEQPQDRIPDLDAAFSVHPPSGVLPPQKSMDFKITFAPPVLGEFHDVLHMMLQQVPHIGDSFNSVKSDGRASTASDDDNISETFLTNDLTQFKDVTGLEIEVKGAAVTPNVILHPYAIYVPGKHLVGTTIKKLFTMANHSFSVITFQWEPHTEKHIIEVEPPYGELDPGMAMDLELGLTGVEPGKISTTLYCYVMNMDEPLALHVEFEVKGPEISIEEPDINYGLVRLGQSVTKEITLTNESQVKTKWTIVNCPSPICDIDEDPMAPSEFIFSPTGGELKPLERIVVSILFTPTSKKTVKRIFEIDVEDGNQCCIDCFAEVQSPLICLLECDIVLTNVYVGVPRITEVILYNQGLLPTHFKWGQAEGEHAKDCSIELDERSGVIGPREQKNILVDFCASREGEFSEIKIPCFIEEMNFPLILNISCKVLGLAMSLKTSVDGIEEHEQLTIDFGKEVALGSITSRFLHIKNESAITTEFNVEMEYFLARPPTPPEQMTEDSASRRKILARTPNIVDPLSKTSSKARADLCRAMLMQGEGAAFLLTPRSGCLPPFGVVTIEMTAYNDSWGEYTDNLIVKVGHLEKVLIPVTMTVTGCPLKFQVFAAKPELQPIIRFGTHMAGIEPIRRKVRINNPSPFDIRIDWRVFNIEDDDTKLLDLDFCFARPFPERDAQGNEIVPSEEPEPEPVVRAATDFIPDSLDTSPIGSRSVTFIVDKEGIITMEPLEKPPKLISVYMNIHGGRKSFIPYNIEPNQMVIEKRSHSLITLEFAPFPATEIDHEIDCIAYASGYMSVDGKAAGVPGKVTRKEAFNAQTLRLEMTARIKPALLTIEPEDEDGMMYRAAMSDLLHNNTLINHSLKTCSAMLSNNTETSMTFKMKVDKPFLLVGLDPSSNPAGLKYAMETNMHTLSPQKNLVVKVALKMTKEMLADYGNKDPNADHNIDIHDTLKIEFNNSTSQELPLYAKIAVPQFELSKRSLDFGKCLVNQQREMQFIITNRTSSHSYWMAHIESKCSSCMDDTFSISPTTGLLDAHITHISDSMMLLKVHFKAKHAEKYEAVFSFLGTLGETSRKLLVSGEGSYDGRYLAVLNV